MLVNSSSSSNSSVPPGKHCLLSPPSSYNFITFNVAYIFLLLPLCSFILYHGVQQWRNKRSTSSAAPMSHSDSFTYHMVIMEVVVVAACVLNCKIIFSEDSGEFFVGGVIYSFAWHGQTFFHLLTCVERYLAVVHPITYLSLRKERGVRIRNISIGCVWMLCFGWLGVKIKATVIFMVIVDFSVKIFSLTVVSFCSLSVLCVLIRPGPGKQGGTRERVDQSKRRAFYTIVAILGVLVLRVAGSLIWAILFVFGERNVCVMLGFDFWFYLPSSLVLPLLFLYRWEKFICGNKNVQ